MYLALSASKALVEEETDHDLCILLIWDLTYSLHRAPVGAGMLDKSHV